MFRFILVVTEISTKELAAGPLEALMFFPSKALPRISGGHRSPKVLRFC